MNKGRWKRGFFYSTFTRLQSKITLVIAPVPHDEQHKNYLKLLL